MSETAGGCAEYDVDKENGGQNPGGEYDSEYEAMSMLTIFMTLLAQLSVCQKPWEVEPYDATGTMT